MSSLIDLEKFGCANIYIDWTLVAREFVLPILVYTHGILLEIEQLTFIILFSFFILMVSHSILYKATAIAPTINTFR